MSGQRESLENAFAASPTTRAEGLSGLLKPKNPAAGAPTSSTAQGKEAGRTVREGDKAVKTAQPIKKRAGRKPHTKTVADQDHINVGFYLAPDLMEAVVAVKTAQHKTYGEVMLDAFEAVSIEQLKEYFEPQVAKSASGMPLAPVKRKPEAGAMRQFRLTVAQQQWLEGMVDKTGAPSRNQLGVAALRLYLKKPTA